MIFGFDNLDNLAESTMGGGLYRFSLDKFYKKFWEYFGGRFRRKGGLYWAERVRPAFFLRFGGGKGG